MAKKKSKHRAIEVGEGIMVSLCETCEHMPSGKVPQSNHQKDIGEPEQPYLYCIKKAFFPDVNYDNKGKPFYDVAKCDEYERYKRQDNGNGASNTRQPEIRRANGE